MIDLPSLTDQLEKLNVVYDDTISKGASLADIKKVYYQIREVEHMIADNKTSYSPANNTITE